MSSPPQPTTPSRPGLLRSLSAAPQVSPPPQTQQRTHFTHAAARKLHLPGATRSDPLDASEEQRKQNVGTEVANPKHRHRHALAELAKSTAHPVQRVAGAAVRRNDHDASQQRSHPAGRGAPVPEASRNALPNALAARGITEADLAAERERQARREEELRRELTGLQRLATDSTTELDDTYYGILEKAGVIKDLIAGLQDLVTRADEMKSGFDGDAKELQDDFHRQIEDVKGFRNASVRVDDMEGRVKRSRERAAKLSARLESSRRALKEWEEREKEWQAKTTKRIRISAASFWVVFALVVGLLIWRSWSQHTSSGSRVIDVLDSGISKLVELKDQAIEDDGRLRVFDEL